MKWKTRERPHVGDRRTRIKFALLPRRCNDGYTRWFEEVAVVEVFSRDFDVYTYAWQELYAFPVEEM